MTSQVAPYGSWKSPITPELIMADAVGLSAPMIHGADTYWCEGRPTEQGRVVLVRRKPDGEICDVTQAPFNVRTRVHEYGGVSYWVTDDALYFSNFVDQRIYRLLPGDVPRPITPDVALRYADLTFDAVRGRLIAVREDHRAGGEPINTLVSLDAERARDADRRGGQVLVSGHNFYASPRLSPDGTRLAWLTWNHPNMPWDGTELWVAQVGADGDLVDAHIVAGGLSESVFQPEWSPDGELYFISDRTGWWNLYRWRAGQAEALYPLAAEFGLPQWVFGMSTYGFASDQKLVCTFFQDGRWRLAVLNLAALTLEEIATPYTELSSLRIAGDRVLFGAGSPTEPYSLVMFDLAERQFTVLRRSSSLTLDPGYLSIPQEIEFSPQATQAGLPVYAYIYAPRNRDFVAPVGEKPPLLVLSHGGPTGAASAAFNLDIQYWTSRGFAVVDVNYGGSTGYGRAFRQRLNGGWGIVDVDDCVGAALYLAGRGDVDPERLAIRGGSAGGYTTLSALAFHNVFKAGASHFGVSDLEALATDTHKFESRYLDNLVGPYPAQRDLYLARSPIHHTDGLNCALILFQGLDDQVVPPEQSRAMYEAVRGKGLPVAYLAYEGEGHGFRQAANIMRTLEAELYFYSKVFGFELADPVAPVAIENL